MEVDWGRGGDDHRQGVGWSGNRVEELDYSEWQAMDEEHSEPNTNADSRDHWFSVSAGSQPSRIVVAQLIGVGQ